MRKSVILFVLQCFLFTANPHFVFSKENFPDLAIQAVTKTHSEIIREPFHSWKIIVDDNVSVINQSVQIEVLEGVSHNPCIYSNMWINFSNLSAIVHDVTTSDMTDKEKAISLWRFTMNNCYNGRWGTCSDGLEHLNVYGYGYCGTFAVVLESLWWAAGLRARHLNIGNHAATEVYYDNDWHYLDAQMRCILLERDNRSIASLEDLRNDFELWNMRRKRRSSSKRRKDYYMTMHPHGHGRSPIYSNNFTLSKNDVLNLTWEKDGKWCLARGDEGGRQVAPEPPIYANGNLKFVRNLRAIKTCREGLVFSKNIDWHDVTAGYLHPLSAKEEACLVYQVKVPYFIPAVSVAGSFQKKNTNDFIDVAVSTDNGNKWYPLWEAEKTGSLHCDSFTGLTQEVTTKVPWKYSYLIRIRMKAEASPLDVGGYGLESIAHLSYNPKSLTALVPGENVISFNDNFKTPRKVKVTYRWLENLPIGISKEFPLEKEKIILSAKVTNIGNSTVKNIPVAFYQGNPKRNGVEISRDVIDSIAPGNSDFAKVKWAASRITDHPRKSFNTVGASIFAVVDPDNSISELDESNNSFARLVKVLSLPHVYIPSKSFVRFQKKHGDTNTLTIEATVGNFSNSRSYGFYLNDHASATDVVVKFFDGNPVEKMQIGTDVLIDCLKPVEFKNIAVDWDVSRLAGLHKIYVQVFPGKNVTHALGLSSPNQIVRTIDLDVYRACMNK